MIVTTKMRPVNIRQEVQLLRSFVIGFAGRDAEGAYDPRFVERMYDALNEKPRHQFTTPNDFLEHLKSF